MARKGQPLLAEPAPEPEPGPKPEPEPWPWPFDIVSLWTVRILDEVVLVQVQGALQIALAAICLCHVEEKCWIATQPVGIFKLRNGIVPLAKVECLLPLCIVLPRLLRRVFIGARWRRSQHGGEAQASQTDQDGGELIPAGTTAAHRVGSLPRRDVADCIRSAPACRHASFRPKVQPRYPGTAGSQPQLPAYAGWTYR